MSGCRVCRDLISFFLLVLWVFGVGSRIEAQSLDARFPSPVRSNEVVGRIAARDIGDSRLTDHFYTFASTPGDLIITIETRNLNGDIDVFTAGTLRPVMKFAVYAESAAPVSKSIYLRQREELILRIEARSPNDDEGVYHLRFGGSFQPSAGEDVASSETPTIAEGNRTGKRVSSVGARIEEPAPPVEVASAPTPEPTPAPVESPTVEPKAEPPIEAAPKASRVARPRPASRRGRSKPATVEETARKPAVDENAPKSNKAAAEREPAVTKAPESERQPPGRNAKDDKITDVTVERPASETSDSTPSKPPPSKETSVSAADTGQRESEGQSKSKLIIELLDGTRIERFMTAIHRVTVENGQIVITGTDGTIERVRLARVIRMSIGP